MVRRLGIAAFVYPSINVNDEVISLSPGFYRFTILKYLRPKSLLRGTLRAMLLFEADVGDKLQRLYPLRLIRYT